MILNLLTLRYNRVMEASDVKTFGIADGESFVVRLDAGKSYLLCVGGSNSDPSHAYIQRGNDSMPGATSGS